MVCQNTSVSQIIQYATLKQRFCLYRSLYLPQFLCLLSFDLLIKFYLPTHNYFNFTLILFLRHMTEIIDVITIQDEQNWQYLQTRLSKPKFRGPNKTIFSLNDSFNLFNQEDRFSFILPFYNNKYNLLFDVESREPQVVVRIYLVSESGQFLKTLSQISRIELIRHCFADKTIYRPNLNPFTGFLYFQINFFRSQNLNKFQKVTKILKEIEIQKLLNSIKKLDAFENFLANEKGKTSYSEDSKSALSLAKTVASTLKSKDFQKIIGMKQKQKVEPTQFSEIKISQFHEFLEPEKYRSQPVSLFRIKKCLKEVEHQHIFVRNLVKRKGVKSNFDTLLIKEEFQKRINQTFMRMLQRNISIESIKIIEAQLGKVTLNLQKMDDKTFRDKTSFLQSLPKNTEYHFIDKYFKSNASVSILMSLSLKDNTLLRFLTNNLTTMSLETKMRIMVQIYSAVNVLWEQNNLIYLVNNMRNVFVTTNLGIKLRDIHNFVKPEKHIMLEQKARVNGKLSESLMNLTLLFFKIFYGKTILYIKPSADSLIERELIDYCKSFKMFEKINFSRNLPENINANTKSFLEGMNYVFYEHINMIGKIVKEKQKKMMRKKKKIWQIEQNEEEEEHFHVQENSDKQFLSMRHVTCWLFKMVKHLTLNTE